MKTKKIFFYAIACMLGGCIPIMSINPFYNSSEVIFEEKLLGTWVENSNNSDMTWIFSRSEDEPNNSYKLIFIDKEGRKGSYAAVLMKLDKTLFMDIYPDEMPWDTKDPNKVNFLYDTVFLIPAHTILKIDSIEPQLLLFMTEDEKSKELFKKHPDAIAYKEIDGKIVLTASTKELQAFILKYADDEKLFPDKITLTRKE